MKQVRFANSSTVPAVPDSGDASSDATIEPVSQENLGPQLKLLPLNDQIRELQTIIRDKWVPNPIALIHNDIQDLMAPVYFQDRPLGALIGNWN